MNSPYWRQMQARYRKVLYANSAIDGGLTIAGQTGH
jgi:hypothetical protein